VTRVELVVPGLYAMSEQNYTPPVSVYNEAAGFALVRGSCYLRSRDRPARLYGLTAALFALRALLSGPRRMVDLPDKSAALPSTCYGVWARVMHWRLTTPGG